MARQLPPLPAPNVPEFLNTTMSATWRQFWLNLLLYISDSPGPPPLANLQLAPYTIAQLLALTPTKGWVAYVSDTVALAAPTWHATVAAGGTTAVNSFVSYNGANWQYE